ncbi:TPA: polysaccharide deacetylase family protein [Clostridioides difficile]|nr:polysaccharide deacetylase family protein [Clostridioides difficile]HBF5455516.1 polysaccharide deacetylase family protein [Clostridioides difficile]
MYVIGLISVVALIFLVHSIIPTYYNKLLNKEVLKNMTGENEIALTFDDGPDKRYTEKLLDVLKENDIQAMFFVVAKNAEKEPEIIKRMLRENHIVGLHSLEHKNAWLYSYSYVKKDFIESTNIMKNLGVDVNYYRPPWGHTNIFSNLFVKKYNLKMTLWDVMAEDWEKDSTVDIIINKLMSRTKESSIICLHDAGENSGGAVGAPERTIEALKIAIPKLKASGLKFVTPERM